MHGHHFRPSVHKGFTRHLDRLHRCPCFVQGYEHPEAVVEVWLRCLVAGQYFSDRLLLDIRAAEYHMDFWKHRLKSGNNTLFLAVARGPIKFVQAIGELLRRVRGQPSKMLLRPTHRIEQRVRTPVHFACAAAHAR